jgi:hypothetical protein
MISSRPGWRGQRRQRRGDLVGIVREIVDHRDAAGGADRLQPALQAFEAAERRARSASGTPSARAAASAASALDALCRPGPPADLVPLAAA